MSVSMFPQLAAQRLVALRLWRKREPRINRTYDQTPILRLVSSQRFWLHFHLIPPGFERAFAISKLAPGIGASPIKPMIDRFMRRFD